MNWHDPNREFAMVEPIRREQQDEPPAVFPVLSLADCFQAQLRPARWLIKGWLPATGLVALFGPSNAYKSFAAIDMALCVAHGMPWHGHQTTHTPVLYLALEGSDGVVRQRVPGWHRHHGLEDTDPPFRVIEVPVILSRLPDAEKLERTALMAFGQPPGLIVVDVLKRTMDGTDSSDEDVAKLLDACRRVFGQALILFITHSGWGDGNRTRGSSDLWGSFDTRLKADGDRETRRVTVEVERHKDADSGAVIAFELVSAETGMADEDGKPITTLVPRMIDAPARTAKPASLTGNAKLIYTALSDLLVRAGVPAPSELDGRAPHGAMVATITAWREASYSRMVDDEKPDTKRKAFKRAVETLQHTGRVAVWEPYVWLCKPPGN